MAYSSKCGGCVTAVRKFSKEEEKTPCAPAPCATKCPSGGLIVTKTLIENCSVTGVTGLARIQSWDIKVYNGSGYAVTGLNVVENFSGLKLSDIDVESEVVGNFTSVSTDTNSIAVNDWAAIVAGNGALVDPSNSSLPAGAHAHLMVRVGIADFRVGNDGTPAMCSFSSNGCNTVTVFGKHVKTDRCGCSIEVPIPAMSASGVDCCGKPLCSSD